MVTVYYWRYAVERAEETDTVEEAVRFLAYGNDRGELASSRIVDGDRTIEGAELDGLVAEAYRHLR